MRLTRRRSPIEAANLAVRGRRAAHRAGGPSGDPWLLLALVLAVAALCWFGLPIIFFLHGCSPAP